MKKILALLPTYNEAENILPLIDEILALNIDGLEVLVVDDNSPDGTSILVAEKADADPRIHLITRTMERGRGTAGIRAFTFARDKNYDAVIEMDADFSHAPRFIPSLLAPLRSGEADIVVGSRLVPGGGETGRHPLRKLITLAANLYIRFLLKLTIRDCTTGYRTYGPAALAKMPWEELKARGPETLQEILIHARKLELRIVERPILFEERRAGESTFDTKTMLHSLAYVWKNRAR